MDPMSDASAPERAILQHAVRTLTPINGSMELLPLCNMNCAMCYVRLTPEEMRAQGRLRTADEWISLGREMAQSGTLFLLLTGGEPLLFPEFKRLYVELRKLGLILTINTNGTLIDEEWADFFAQYKPRRINITLYGTDEDTYARLCRYPGGFDKTVRAIRLLRERGVDVKLSISLTRENVAELDKAFAIAKELDVPLHVDPYMFPTTRERTLPFAHQVRLTPEDAARASRHAFRCQFPDDINRQYVQQAIARVQDPEFPRGNGSLSCYAGSCSFTINWQGQMRPCVMMCDPKVDVFKTGFRNGWDQLRQQTEPIRLNPKCSQCHLKPVCKTCAAAALAETGSCDGLPAYCCRYAEEYYRLLLKEAETYGQNL